jgi:hypothetical protein
MRLVEDTGVYAFYIATTSDNERIYNIVPSGSLEPHAGYKNMQWIEKLKGVKFPDRFQPTLSGMSNLYGERDNGLS